MYIQILNGVCGGGLFELCLCAWCICHVCPSICARLRLCTCDCAGRECVRGPVSVPFRR